MTRLPEPSLTQIYRLEAALGEPVDVGDVSPGRRRIVPLTGGTFWGPELNGKLLPGASADWQIVLGDGTVVARSHEGDTKREAADRAWAAEALRGVVHRSCTNRSARSWGASRPTCPDSARGHPAELRLHGPDPTAQRYHGLHPSPPDHTNRRPHRTAPGSLSPSLSR